MRISDWSSDVCSSDLAADHLLDLFDDDDCGFVVAACCHDERSALCGRRQRADRVLDLVEGRAVVRMQGLARELDGDHRRRAVHMRQQRRLDAVEVLDFQVVDRSEEHTSELQSLMRISYAVFCLKKKK